MENGVEVLEWVLKKPVASIQRYKNEILPRLTYINDKPNFEEVYEMVMNQAAAHLSPPPASPVYEAVSPGETASPLSTPPATPEYRLDYSPSPPPTPNADDPGEGTSSGPKRRRCN